MAKKNRRKRSPESRPPIEPVGESQAADALTVAWMLAVMTALMCELGAVGAAWAVSARPDWANLALLRDMSIFTSLVVGTVSLAMAAAVWKIRREPPPVGITVFAVVVGAEPLLLLLGRALLR